VQQFSRRHSRNCHAAGNTASLLRLECQTAESGNSVKPCPPRIDFRDEAPEHAVYDEPLLSTKVVRCSWPTTSETGSGALRLRNPLPARRISPSADGGGSRSKLQRLRCLPPHSVCDRRYRVAALRTAPTDAAYPADYKPCLTPSSANSVLVLPGRGMEQSRRVVISPVNHS
jgi:hypothetical protein